jgi:hypothetical protein
VMGTMQQHLEADAVIAAIHQNPDIFNASLEGNALQINLPELEPVIELIRNRIES